jgi:hypothetical protein
MTHERDHSESTAKPHEQPRAHPSPATLGKTCPKNTPMDAAPTIAAAVIRSLAAPRASTILQHPPRRLAGPASRKAPSRHAIGRGERQVQALSRGYLKCGEHSSPSRREMGTVAVPAFGADYEMSPWTLADVERATQSLACQVTLDRNWNSIVACVQQH